MIEIKIEIKISLHSYCDADKFLFQKENVGHVKVPKPIDKAMSEIERVKLLA